MRRPPPVTPEMMDGIRAARAKWRPRPPGLEIEPVGPGEESVWDFPRPPDVQEVAAPLEASFAGRVVARTRQGRRVVETAGAPVYFFPPDDVETSLLRPSSAAVTMCEWKGWATYFDLVVEDKVSTAAAFAYPEPLADLGRGYDRIAGWIAFYAGRIETARVGGTIAAPQPGGFYAGWVLPTLRGPLKGARGSETW